LRPAIDVSRSVSRIGGAAQSEVMRKTARNVRIDMARFESLEALTRVGLDLDPKTQRTVARGRVLRELMRQPRFTVREPAEQVFALTAVSAGWLDELKPLDARHAIDQGARDARQQEPDLWAALDAGERFPESWQERFQAVLRRRMERIEP
jgi:F-type H+-transporting ATPase subunit alpha